MRTIDRKKRRAVLVMAFVASALIFAADALSPIDGAVAVLYTGVVLMVAPLGRKFIVAAGCISALLALTAFLWGHASDLIGGALLRFVVSLVAILITVLLSVRDRSARVSLAEQVRILEASHDTVIIRDSAGIVRYWNEGAERLHGWSRDEALGRHYAELFDESAPVEEIARSMREAGTWSGEVVRTRRDGARLILASRWLQRHDPEGNAIGIIEASADLTESRRAQAERLNLERRYSTIFNSAGFAALECDLSGALSLVLSAGSGDVAASLRADPALLAAAVERITIHNANPAALEMFDAQGAGDLIAAELLACSIPDVRQALETIFVVLVTGATQIETETRFITRSGRSIDAVLRLSVLPDGTDWSRVLLMAFDVTERNEARAKIERTSAELAHAGRVSVLGQLAASIAHEVNQPLAAIINYGKSGKRWLTRPSPDLGEVADCLDKIVSNANRAAEVVGRVRFLARKSAPQSDSVDLVVMVQDAIELLRREIHSAKATVRVEHSGPISMIDCDRVQVQQVIVNLLMNGLQAMRGIDGRREILVSLEDSGDMVAVVVSDTGAGIAGEPTQIFEPFFSTKSDGMGLGLSICRTIIEAQGGQIQASNNDGSGATVAFTLPRSNPQEGRHHRGLIS
ncbi:MAG: PAS domain S-box protein [Rhodopseudomonas palustris]|uniref:histidine kinase n=1 Tax=Rhodopseudomonas palustris TaxID=1076 RepID=A0A933RVD5_RHOPL|nr:PAS domain S-box protein [Rhodopseudomonas palustris]